VDFYTSYLRNYFYPPHLLASGERLVVAQFRPSSDGNPLFLVSVEPIQPPGVQPPITRKELQVAGLSPRESDVASMAIQGYSVTNIAACLQLTENTVSTYLKRLYRKLRVSSRAELSFELLNSQAYHPGTGQRSNACVRRDQENGLEMY